MVQRNTNKRITAISFSLVLLILLTIPMSSSAVENEASATHDYNISIYSKDNDYTMYREKNKNVALADSEVLLDLKQTKSDNIVIENLAEYFGRQDVLKIQEGTGYAEISFNVEKPGLYNIGFDYYVLEGSKNDPEFRLEIDGKLPFYDAEKFELNRVWADDGEIAKDTRGNDIRPDQAEIKQWQSYLLRDSNGIYNGPFYFNFTKGIHTIRIYLVRSNIAIADMELFCEKESPSYETYHVSKSNLPAKEIRLTYQAEKADKKSSPVLFPIYDRSSASTEPNDPAKILLNTIGSSHWKFQGEWISWKVNVPQDGYYKFSFRVRQDIVRGMNSTRRLTIDDTVPFKEANQIEFPYKIGWYEYSPGRQDSSYEFYLSAGEHELKLEVVPGAIGQSLRNVENIVLRLSTLYRKIIVITGVSPDPNRDYFLEDNIPDLLKEITDLAADMRREARDIESYNGTDGSMASQLTEIARELDSYIKEPYTLPQRLAKYEGNITALGVWLRTLREQPLEIDSFQVMSPDQTSTYSSSKNVFQDLLFNLQSFVYSFIVDYSSIGNVYDSNAINVWVPAGMSGGIGIGSGREQINIIKMLIDDKFSAERKINVNLKMVDSTNTILQATFAGKGPDAALCIPKSVPVDWAMRGALVNLEEYSDFADISQEFYPSAFVPYEYEGGTYAFPETQIFNMFFYRKDIFGELGIEPPQTWDDFYNMIPKLQKNMMEIGIPSEYNYNGVTGVSEQLFQSLLFQSNTNYYSDDLRATTFDTPEALDAFKKWTGLYSQYGLPLYFAFFNRFRTGEMPCGFAEYTMFNMFEVAAPELANLWTMIPLPGTKKPDGTIDRTTSSNSMASIIFEKSAKKDMAYQLISWWVSSETQAQYGKNLESLLGTGARYPTANKIAFEELPWSASESASIKEQWNQTWDVPQIPGSYFISRGLSNAFRKVVYNWQNERETLYDYSKKMNEEIFRKRKEFGLEG